MTREQENTIDRICTEHGGDPIHVRHGYVGGHVEATHQSGASWKINEDGIPTQQRRGDFAVDWTVLEAA